MLERVSRFVTRSHSAGRGVFSVVVMTLMLAVSSSELLAQDTPLRPPTTTAPPSGPKFIVLGVVVLLTGLVVFVATLKSKRGHQD